MKHKCDHTNRMSDPRNISPEARKGEECPTLKIAGADGVTPLAKFGPYFRPLAFGDTLHRLAGQRSPELQDSVRINGKMTNEMSLIILLCLIKSFSDILLNSDNGSLPNNPQISI